jgi:hypothetical protein
MLNTWRIRELIDIKRGAIRLVSKHGLQEIVHLEED